MLVSLPELWLPYICLVPSFSQESLQDPILPHMGSVLDPSLLSTPLALSEKSQKTLILFYLSSYFQYLAQCLK